MRVLVVLSLAWCCSSQIILPYNAIPMAFKFQSTDDFGHTTFGFQTIDQSRNEVRLADGRVHGQFSYIDSNGEPAITYYEAGPQGYRVLGSNILPEAPIVDLVQPIHNLVAPEPVVYTAEVAHARAVFQKIYDEAAAGSAAAVDDQPSLAPFAVEPLDNLAPEPPVYSADVAHARAVFQKLYDEAAAAKPPVYTAEVALARDVFQKMYDEAAAAAAAAPDDPTFQAPLPAEPTPEEIPSAAEPEALKPQLSSDDETTAEEPAEEPAAEIEPETARIRRDVSKVPLPYLIAVPTETEAKLTTKQFETVKAATPADTTKFEITTKEHVFKVPAIKYVQPVVEVKPVTYTSLTPQVLPYPSPFPYYPFAFPGFSYNPTILTPYSQEE